MIFFIMLKIIIIAFINILLFYQPKYDIKNLISITLKF